MPILDALFVGFIGSIVGGFVGAVLPAIQDRESGSMAYLILPGAAIGFAHEVSKDSLMYLLAGFMVGLVFVIRELTETIKHKGASDGPQT